MRYESILESNIVDMVNNTLSQFDSLENIIMYKLDTFREDKENIMKKNDIPFNEDTSRKCADLISFKSYLKNHIKFKKF